MFLFLVPKHRLWELAEAVLTCTHNQCLEQIYLIYSFLMKFSIFRAEISPHKSGQVFVMRRPHPVNKVYMGGVNLRLSVSCIYG